MKFSLKTKILLTVNILLFLIMSLGGAIIVREHQKYSLQVLDKKIDQVMNYLVEANVGNIWELNTKNLELFTATAVKDEDILYVQFFDPKGKALTTMDLPKMPHQLIEKPIPYKSETIGIVKLGYSKSSIEKQFISDISTIFGLTLAMIVLISTGVFWVVSRISSPVSKGIENLNSSANLMKRSSEELLLNSEQSLNAISLDASLIEETASSLEEISGMISKNAKNSIEANEIILRTSSEATDGTNVINKLKSSMDDILKSNKQIEELVKIIQEIEHKTSVIDEIVFQTKLLSFNASIEAERAGEHGRGFAVVAQEVGHLAQMSGEAAKQISAIVKNSLKNSQSIAKYNKETVQNGNTMVKEVTELLVRVQDNLAKAAKISEEITIASKEQDQGITQINVAMNSIEERTMKNADVANQTKELSFKLDSQSDELRVASDSLSSAILGENTTVRT